MFAYADTLILKAMSFVVEKRGASGFGTEAVLIMVVAGLAAVMWMARDAIGNLITRAVAAIGGA